MGSFLKRQYGGLEKEKKRIEHLMSGIETTLLFYQVEGTIGWKKLFDIYRFGKAEGQRSLTPKEREIIDNLPRLEKRDREVRSGFAFTSGLKRYSSPILPIPRKCSGWWSGL